MTRTGRYGPTNLGTRGEGEVAHIKLYTKKTNRGRQLRKKISA
jgi:hypothetical protein